MATHLNDYRLLGGSGLRVSPLTLGTMTFGVGPGSWGSSDEEAAQIVDLFVKQARRIERRAGRIPDGHAERSSREHDVRRRQS